MIKMTPTQETCFHFSKPYKSSSYRSQATGISTFSIFLYILSSDRIFFRNFQTRILLVFDPVLDFAAVLYTGKKHGENSFTASFQESRKLSLCLPGLRPRSQQLGALSLHTCHSHLFKKKNTFLKILSLWGACYVIHSQIVLQQTHSQCYCVFVFMLDCQSSTTQATLKEVKYTWHSPPHTEIPSRPFSPVKTKHSLLENSFYIHK